MSEAVEVPVLELTADATARRTDLRRENTDAAWERRVQAGRDPQPGDLVPASAQQAAMLELLAFELLYAFRARTAEHAQHGHDDGRAS